MLDARRMQLLRAVVTSGSVTTAATNLGYTPSAISQQLAVLEREAGVPLLEKVGRGVRPTPAGEMVSEQAGELARLLSDTAARLADFKNGCAGRLRVRWAASFGAVLVPAAVAAYRRARPEVRIEPCLTADPLRQVQESEADIALITLVPGAPNPEGVRVVPLLEDRFLVVLPLGHRLAKQDVVDLGQLADEPWIATGVTTPGDACDEHLRQACASAGFSPNVAIYADDFPTAHGFVAAGMGVRLASELGLTTVSNPGVEIRPVRRPEPVIRLALAVRPAVAEQRAVTAMVDELRAVAESTRAVSAVS